MCRDEPCRAGQGGQIDAHARDMLHIGPNRAQGIAHAARNAQSLCTGVMGLVSCRESAPRRSGDVVKDHGTADRFKVAERRKPAP